MSLFFSFMVKSYLKVSENFYLILSVKMRGVWNDKQTKKIILSNENRVSKRKQTYDLPKELEP